MTAMNHSANDWTLHIVQGQQRDLVEDSTVEIDCSSRHFTLEASIPDPRGLWLNVCGNDNNHQLAATSPALDCFGEGRGMAEARYEMYANGSPQPYSLTLSESGSHYWPTEPIERWSRATPPSADTNGRWLLERDVHGFTTPLKYWPARMVDDVVYLVAALLPIDPLGSLRSARLVMKLGDRHTKQTPTRPGA